MTKSDFLEQLEQKLSLICEEERNDILLEYGSYIEDKIANGYTEEQAIQGFGDLDELANDILDAYKIHTEDAPTKTDQTLDKAYSKVDSFFNKIGNFSLNDIFHLLFDAFILIVLLFIGRFLIIDIFLEIVLNLCSYVFNMNDVIGLSSVWYFLGDILMGLFKIIYFVASAFFFITILLRRIRRLRQNDHQTNVVEDIRQSLNKETKDLFNEPDSVPPIPSVQPQKSYHKRTRSQTPISEMVIKLILVLVSLPTICCIIGFGSALIGLCFIGIYQQVYSIGLVLLIVGLLVGSISVQWFLVYLWPKKEGIQHA